MGRREKTRPEQGLLSQKDFTISAIFPGRGRCPHPPTTSDHFFNPVPQQEEEAGTETTLR